jgi:UDP-N-acetyl-2-amino-2-deoxyglucuronate dehydrogenase
MAGYETVDFAVLGVGMVADFHRQAIEQNASDGARLVAVGHHDASRFEQIGRRFGVPCVSGEDLFARPDVDVVCICTPSGQHAEQAIAAARAGKHVLAEKPMALNLADADAMVSACEAAAVKLGVVFQRRTELLSRKIKAAIEAGDFGELTLGAVTLPYYRSQEYYDQGGWRGTWAQDGGGVLMNQGIHLIDLLVWFMGDPIEVQARVGTLRHEIEVEDTLAATLRFANGALGTITATTTAAPGFPARLELYGTRGGVQVEGESVRSWQLADSENATVEPPRAAETAKAGSGADPRDISAAGHAAVLGDFISALREDRAPAINGREGRRSLGTVCSIYRSAGLAQ